jgi:UDP-N-acetylmuramate: L-alanyl-gamma-D-glutamyl-meso-diaminopimelate ligase
MHIHVIGICGTFMAGMASLAKDLGHTVTGCDQNVYPPMSTFLESKDIQITQGFDANQVSLKPDLFIVGNVVSRGNPLMEEILNQNLRYQSGPQWLYENLLHDKWVIAVSGTHGKTTTTSMINWILRDNEIDCGYLIGGIPGNFRVVPRHNLIHHFLSSRLMNTTQHFLINAQNLSITDQRLW